MNPVGLVAAVDGYTAVALLDGIVVIHVVTGRKEVTVLELGMLGLGFLDTHDVRLLFVHPVEKALAGRGADSIGV